MDYSLPTLLRAAVGWPPRLVCSPSVWNQSANELERRTGGGQESGAFLLGSVKGQTRRIQQFLYSTTTISIRIASSMASLSSTAGGSA